MAIYRDEDGSDEWSIWSRYEWNTELLNGYWYEGYEFESTMTWRNLAVGLLAGDFLVADLWIKVWRGAWIAAMATVTSVGLFVRHK